MQNKPINQ